ncbi:MAG: tandem-95 repeat protein [Candidatus Thiothrix singaporensis]|uniref:Tandem-95 repeat protein n=1 Tax=Candidatus Thiothrix singaporensis TaxID=2799669 RepID=A0A7L6ANX6_9GAMM|nr:MAG: tandem-95 repeat protein [Candidatus Thiothrix singaporensis]
MTLNLLDNDGSPKPTIVSNTSPTAGGKVTLNKTTGVMTYTPKSGFSGADSFSYTVKNASGLTAVATVTITVKAGVPPTPANDAATTEYNTPVTLNLLDNDGSPKPTIVSNTSPTAGGKVTLNKTTGVMTYTPKSGFSGTDSFNYTVKNASGLTAPATVTITVKAGVPPTPVDDSATTKYNTPVTLNLLDNDGSPKPTIVSNTTPVAGGRVTLNKTTGAMTYTPKSGFSGTDSFSYTVKNASGLTAPAAVTITVQSNAAPTANGGWYEVGVNRARLIKLGGNDPDGDAVSVKSYTTPAHGKVSKSGSNYYYTPNAGYVAKTHFPTP